MSQPLPEFFLEDQQVRQFFGRPDNKYNYVTYRQFCHLFPVDKNYVGKINRAIIDIHLRFHNHVFEQMAPYKWVPLALAAVFQMIRVRRPPVLFPVVWVYLFDYYFYDYFAWREREKNIINIQSSFDYKLAKASNIEKKLKMANNYLEVMTKKERSEPPMKYLCFGEYSPYLYSSNQIDKLQTQIYLTNIFEFYMKVVNFKWKDIKAIFKDVSDKAKEYQEFMKQWRKNKKSKDKRFKSDFKELLNQPSVNPEKIAGFWPLLEEQLANYKEVWDYHWTKSFEKKKPFALKNLYTFKEDIKPIDVVYRYKLQTNQQGLAIYYTAIAVPWLVAKLFKR